MASLHVMKHTKRGEHAAEPAKPKEHAGTIAKQFRLYMTFSLVELICVFTPVLVYIIAVLYLGKAERSVFDYPDSYLPRWCSAARRRASICLATSGTRAESDNRVDYSPTWLFALRLWVRGVYWSGCQPHPNQHLTILVWCRSWQR